MLKKIILNFKFFKFALIYKISLPGNFKKLSFEQKLNTMITLCTSADLLLRFQALLKRFNFLITDKENYIYNKEEIIQKSTQAEIIKLFKENILYSTNLYKLVIKRFKELNVQDSTESLIQFAMQGIKTTDNADKYIEVIYELNKQTMTNPNILLKFLFTLYNSLTAKTKDIKNYKSLPILKELLKEVHSKIFSNPIPYELLQKIPQYIPCKYGTNKTFEHITSEIVNDHILSHTACKKLLLDSGDIICSKISSELYSKLVFYANS